MEKREREGKSAIRAAIGTFFWINLMQIKVSNQFDAYAFYFHILIVTLKVIISNSISLSLSLSQFVRV
jgi:hypothetical protein